MLERDMYIPAVNGSRGEGWLLYRIVDGSPGKKPFDIGGVARDGRAVGLEAKIFHGQLSPSTPFPQGLFAEHQLAWLGGFAQRHGLALALIFSAKDRRYWLIRIRTPDDMTKQLSELQHVYLQRRSGPDALVGWSYILGDR